MAFESLTDKLQNVFKNLRSKGRLTEEDVKSACKEVKMALLEAELQSRKAVCQDHRRAGRWYGGFKRTESRTDGHQDRQ